MLPRMATKAIVNKAAVEQFLRDRNRSLRWLAGEMGTNPGHLSKMLSGGRTMRADTLYRIAALLQVDPAAIGAIAVPDGVKVAA